MVATMKKYVFLAFHKEYDQFLNDLRNLGMIHVAEQDRTEVDEEGIQDFLSETKKLNEAKKLLLRYRDKKSNKSFNEPDPELGKKIPTEIERIENKRSALNQQLQVSIKEKESLKYWGNFNPENIKKLRDEGYYLNFFVCANNRYNAEWEELYDIFIVNKDTSRTYFITLSKDGKMEDLLDLEEEKLPDISLDNLNNLIESLKLQIEQQDRELEKLSNDIPSIDLMLTELNREITYKKVVQSTTPVADNKIMLLQGWAPEDKVSEISSYLESKSVYFETSDPKPEDDTPIKFKNNKFAKIFEPIAEMYELPSYNEIDLTPYFAPFYMIFFGLSLGDIGYGGFLLLVATIVKLVKKGSLAKSLRGTLTLVQVLGASTMVCGLLQGGFFGYSIYEVNIPFLQRLGELIYFDNTQMFTLSLVLGVVQIMFGKTVQIFNRIKQFGFVHALSIIGWVVFLMSFIIAYLFPTFLPMTGTVHSAIMILTGVLIVFFNSPGKNPFYNLGMSLWDTYNMATGLLGDILSYVRLFALGLSGGILAGVFSSLATGMSPDVAILGPLVTVIIFVLGHGICLFMNALGAFVHPLRLTFVEFYGNSEFTGGGKKYEPFSNV